MAGSDKKEQKFAAEQSTSGAAELLAIQDPVVTHFTMPGNPVGLIPREKLDEDQKTTITTWGVTIPPGATELFRLQYARAGSNEWKNFEEHSVVGGTVWLPLVFTIPSTFLLDRVNEGQFDLRYEHVNFIGQSDYSSGRVPIHIDKVPPNGATPPNKMVFAITPPITDATFGTDDFLEATIPGWTGEVADVRVAYGWREGKLPEDPADIILIGPVPITPDGKVQIPKAAFVREGDGECCGGYVLLDKAGNISNLSLYELMSVALGLLPPKPLTPAPIVTDATGGDLLRTDIIDGGVEVSIPKITNGKSTDKIAVKWGGSEVRHRIPVGANPDGGFKFFVPWDHILKEYGAATGVKSTDVQYIAYRGVEPFESITATVRCNLSLPGPENPNPETGNPNLEKVGIFGKSATEDELIDTDEDEDIFAKIKLVAPLVNGDSYQVMWNGTPIGEPYVIDVADDTAGDVISIELDWDVIRDEGPSATMPVWYVLSNPAHPNPQEPAPGRPSRSIS